MRIVLTSYSGDYRSIQIYLLLNESTQARIEAIERTLEAKKLEDAGGPSRKSPVKKSSNKPYSSSQR